MKESQARFWLGIGIPVAGIAAIVVAYLATRSALPDRLATHFDASGSANGSMSPGMFLIFTLVMAGVGASALVLLARSQRALPAQLAPFVGFLGGFFVGLGSAIAVVTFVGQRGLDSWQDADGVGLLIVLPLLSSFLLGAVAARAALVLPVAEVMVDVADQPVMDLPIGQNAVWAETMHSNLLARLGLVITVAGVLIAIGTFWWLVIPCVLTGLLILSLATLQVRADRAGLHVKYGLVPWPRTTVAVDRIASASVIDVRPMEWGGWGYRGSLKLMKQAAVVHRAGPGIRLDLKDGKVFVVTVDDPITPVALLNAEVARANQPA